MFNKIKNWINEDTFSKISNVIIGLLMIITIGMGVYVAIYVNKDIKVPVHVKCYINKVIAYDGTAAQIVKNTHKRLHFIEAETNRLILIMDKDNCILEYDSE